MKYQFIFLTRVVGNRVLIGVFKAFANDLILSCEGNLFPEIIRDKTEGLIFNLLHNHDCFIPLDFSTDFMFVLKLSCIYNLHLF